jgi:hypothetical protein
MDSTEVKSNSSLMISTLETYINLYINTLNEKEKHAYEIARDHLGMSFQIEKSIGYIQWKKENITD